MCVDPTNCGGYCPECQHDTIKRLRTRVAELEAENERLCALVEKKLENKDGYTIIDFLRVWHDQQKDRADRAEADVLKWRQDFKTTQAEMIRLQDALIALRLDYAQKAELVAALRARVAELEGQVTEIPTLCRRYEAERDRLREALGALGVIGDGYCFCSEHRDPHKERHEPECRQASAALQEGER